MFKVGDKVRRKSMSDTWFWSCAKNGKVALDVFEISQIYADSIWLIGMREADACWEAKNFELATSITPLKKDGRECALISKDVPVKGTVIGYFNDTKEVFVEKPSIDWTAVPVDAKIKVRDRVNDPWQKRHFSHVDPEGLIHAFDDGRTSWSAVDGNTYWKFAELAE